MNLFDFYMIAIPLVALTLIGTVLWSSRRDARLYDLQTTEAHVRPKYGVLPQYLMLVAIICIPLGLVACIIAALLKASVSILIVCLIVLLVGAISLRVALGLAERSS